MKVLIVDSSALIVKRLEEMLLLTETTKTVYSADSYAAGLDVFGLIKPDVVLLGISSPDEKSMKLLSSIKMFNNTIPVIILSLNMTDHLYEQYASMGADFFLDKYHEFQEIPALIKSIADRKD